MLPVRPGTSNCTLLHDVSRVPPNNAFLGPPTPSKPLKAHKDQEHVRSRRLAPNFDVPAVDRVA